MEKQYKVEMFVTVNDKDLKKGQTIDELILDSLEEAPFQVDTVTVRPKTKYSEMDNTEIRKITYEKCPIKCTSCSALCDEMPVGQCRKNLSEKLDKE